MGFCFDGLQLDGALDTAHNRYGYCIRRVMARLECSWLVSVTAHHRIKLRPYRLGHVFVDGE